MKIEIRVTYPATDGSMPENVMVEIDTTGMQDGTDLTQGVIMPILDRLIHAPGAARAVANRTASGVDEFVRYAKEAQVRP